MRLSLRRLIVIQKVFSTLRNNSKKMKRNIQQATVKVCNYNTQQRTFWEPPPVEKKVQFCVFTWPGQVMEKKKN